MIRGFSRLLAFFAVLMAAPLLHAQSFEAGTHYFLIEPAQPTNLAASGKVEVVEVFSYGCPACFQFNPVAKKLQAALPPNAEFHYVHASFLPAEQWPLFQRAYYTAQILGVAEKAHDAMFTAIWDNGPLSIRETGTNKPVTRTIEDVAKFYADFGAKPDEFVAVANSFGVNTKMRQADAYVKAHGVDSTPTIVVAGKYRLTGRSAGGADQLVELVKFLVQKESAGR